MCLIALFEVHVYRIIIRQRSYHRYVASGWYRLAANGSELTSKAQLIGSRVGQNPDSVAELYLRVLKGICVFNSFDTQRAKTFPSAHFVT